MTAKITVPDSDWPMYDWEPADICTDAIVMALKGLDTDLELESPVTVITEDGAPLRILGIRRDESGNPQIVVGGGTPR